MNWKLISVHVSRSRAFASASRCVCVFVCVPLCGDWQCLSWYLQSLSLDRSLAAPPTAAATRRRQQIYQLLVSPYRWLHCLHCWHSKLLCITIWLSYTKYDIVVYTCHMTGTWPTIYHIPVIWQVYDHLLAIYLAYDVYMTDKSMTVIW